MYSKRFRYTAVLFCLLFPSLLFPQPPYENYNLVWSDEFDVDGLPNPANWTYEKGCSVRNNEAQYYAEAREKNSRIENGTLIIEAHRESLNGCEYTSANVLSKKRDYKYGLFEIRAKIDIRPGSWPAWWWLPNSGGWPKGGEIDMMEFYKGNLLFNVMDGNQKWTSKTKSASSLGGSTWAAEFHTWTWEWDSTKIDLWLDGTLMNHYPVANADGTGPNGENPFKRPGYMLINQAIGGNNGGDPSGTTFPVQYIVDYVRIYKQGKDTTAPQILTMSASTFGTITVTFTEPVAKASSETLSNYIVSTGVSIQAVKLQPDGLSVIITTGKLDEGSQISMTVNNITDLATPPNIRSSASAQSAVTREGIKLTGKIIGNGTPWNNTKGSEYDKALDGSTSTFADCTGDLVWAGYEFDSAAVITAVRVYPRDGYASRMEGRTVEVSTDGVTWKKIHTFTTAPAEGSFTMISLSPGTAVRFVRYNGTGGYLNIAEIEFMGYYQSTSKTVHPAVLFTGKSSGVATITVYNPSGRLLDRYTLPADMTFSREPIVQHARSRQKTTTGVRLFTVDDGNRLFTFAACAR